MCNPLPPQCTPQCPSLRDDLIGANDSPYSSLPVLPGLLPTSNSPPLPLPLPHPRLRQVSGRQECTAVNCGSKHEPKGLFLYTVPYPVPYTLMPPVHIWKAFSHVEVTTHKLPIPQTSTTAWSLNTQMSELG